MREELLRLARSQGEGSFPELDLTNAEHLGLALRFADELLATAVDPEQFRVLEADLIARRDEVPLLVHLAAKLSLSRSLVLALTGPAHVSVVFAVYKEHRRILTGEEVCGGEDFLRRKVRQLEWLFAGRDDLTWDMFVVDDGCPEGSGRIAQRIVDDNGLGDRVQVLHLARAIADGLPVVSPLTDTDQSMKGGSIELGMWEAARPERTNHVVVFTDADLSTHLGQTGLLLESILVDGADAAIGSRRLPASVVVKKGARDDRGKLFIYLWKRIISIMPDVIDTQCGFKAFRATTVREIVAEMLDKKFAFDIELLIKTLLRRPDSIAQVPIAWIDSEALSTTTDLQPYLSMLQAIARMYRTYLPPGPVASRFADFVDELDDAAWEYLLGNIPVAITSRDPQEFNDFDQIGVEELRRASSGRTDR